MPIINLLKIRDSVTYKAFPLFSISSRLLKRVDVARQKADTLINGANFSTPLFSQCDTGMLLPRWFFAMRTKKRALVSSLRRDQNFCLAFEAHSWTSRYDGELRPCIKVFSYEWQKNWVWCQVANLRGAKEKYSNTQTDFLNTKVWICSFCSSTRHRESDTVVMRP